MYFFDGPGDRLLATRAASSGDSSDDGDSSEDEVPLARRPLAPSNRVPTASSAGSKAAAKKATASSAASSAADKAAPPSAAAKAAAAAETGAGTLLEGEVDDWEARS